LAPRQEFPRYLPAEDTYLLRGALEPFSGDSCLEIGFGSGAVLAGVAGRFQLAVGTDIIDLEKATLARAPRLDLVLADRAGCFREGSFDLVFFNPPYVPSDQIEDRTVDGGPTGIEVPTSFLEEGLRVLRDKGIMMVLLSDRGNLEGFVARCGAMGLDVEQVAQRKLFYEDLVVFRLERKAIKAKTKGHAAANH
jgi:release factor glutamine methyltransferase